VNVLKIDKGELTASLIEPVSSAIYAQFTADYSPEIIAARVLDKVNRTLVEDKSEIMAYVDKKTALSAGDIEPFVVEVYNKYSQEVVADISERILASLEEVLSELEVKAEAAAAAAQIASQSAIKAEEARSAAEAVAAAPAVEEKPVEVKPIITVPDFSSFTAVNEEEYAGARGTQRDSVLDALLQVLGE